MALRPLAAVMIALLFAMISTTSAHARKAKHHHSQRIHTVSVPAALCADNNGRYLPCAGSQPSQPVRYSKAGRTMTRAVRNTESTGFAGFTASSLVNEARRYIGTNPTGRSRLWCGAFMDLVLRHTGHAGGGNLASAYAHYGTRVSGPQVGAIAVMGRRGGGHVGVVSGIDANGNPIIISGNHNRTTAESVYPRGRIYAYVMP